MARVGLCIVTQSPALDDAPLGEAVKRLRNLEGIGWKEIDDPYAEFDRLRSGIDEIH